MSGDSHDFFRLMDEILHATSIGALSKMIYGVPWLLEATAGDQNRLQQDNEYALEIIKYEMIEHVFFSLKRTMDITTRFDEEESM